MYTSLSALLLNEFRLLRRDTSSPTILFILPALALFLCTPSLAAILRERGYEDAIGIELSLPAMSVMFGSLGAAFLGFAIFREHQWHTWQRLAVSPAKTWEILIAKLFIPLSLVFFQQIFLLVLCIVIYDFSLPTQWIFYGINSLLFAFCVVGIGLLATSFCRSHQKMNAILHILALTLTALSGAFIPLEGMPETIQFLAKLTPSYWFVESQTDILLEINQTNLLTSSIVLFFQGCLFLTLASMRFEAKETKYC